MADAQILSAQDGEKRRDPRARTDIERPGSQRRERGARRADDRGHPQARQEKAMKDWDVEVLYGGRPETMLIRAPSKQAAEALADEALRRRRRKPNTKVIGAKESTRK